MIPFFEWRVIHIGPIPIQVWGLFVALGFVGATLAGLRRAKRLGLATDRIWDLVFWFFVSAFVSARLFHVLFYDFAHYLARPFDAINPALPGYSVIGGLLGAAAAFVICVRRWKLDFLAYADLCMYALPLGLGIGRLGCFSIHDHPGTATSFFLGVRYPDGIVRHDHGLYLSLVGLAIFLVFSILGRKPRPAGFFLGWWLILDGSSRFLLDFLRVADARYGGLTPTQWVLPVTVGIGTYLAVRMRFGHTSHI